MSGHWSIQISSPPARKLFCTVKVKSNHRSKFPNLSNWKDREAWKKSGLQRDSHPWTPGCRCDALPTVTTAIHIWIISYILHVISLLTGRYERLLLSNCLNWEIYCDDHSSLSSTTAVHIWIISYIHHVISFLKWRCEGFSLPSNRLNWEIYCDDHSSFSSTTTAHIWIFSYIHKQ